jgi:hypothetical protein
VKGLNLKDLIEFAKGVAEFLVVVGLIALMVWRRTKTYQDIFGESQTKIQTLFGKDRWWQPLKRGRSRANEQHQLNVGRQLDWRRTLGWSNSGVCTTLGLARPIPAEAG